MKILAGDSAGYNHNRAHRPVHPDFGFSTVNEYAPIGAPTHIHYGMNIWPIEYTYTFSSRKVSKQR